MEKEQSFPDWILELESYARQYCELEKIEYQLSPVLREFNSAQATTTHMSVRLAAENEIRSRKDYICSFIGRCVIERIKESGRLSKYPELHTNHNEK